MEANKLKEIENKILDIKSEEFDETMRRLRYIIGMKINVDKYLYDEMEELVQYRFKVLKQVIEVLDEKEQEVCYLILTKTSVMKEIAGIMYNDSRSKQTEVVSAIIARLWKDRNKVLNEDI